MVCEWVFEDGVGGGGGEDGEEWVLAVLSGRGHAERTVFEAGGEGGPVG